MAEQPINPIPKFTLKEWVKHPTTILLAVVSTVLWALIFAYTNSLISNDKYSKKRVETLEKKVDDYTNAVLFKDAIEKQLKSEIQKQKFQIDSLKNTMK